MDASDLADLAGLEDGASLDVPVPVARAGKKKSGGVTVYLHCRVCGCTDMGGSNTPYCTPHKKDVAAAAAGIKSKDVADKKAAESIGEPPPVKTGTMEFVEMRDSEAAKLGHHSLLHLYVGGRQTNRTFTYCTFIPQ